MLAALVLPILAEERAKAKQRMLAGTTDPGEAGSPGSRRPRARDLAAARLAEERAKAKQRQGTRTDFVERGSTKLPDQKARDLAAARLAESTGRPAA